MTGFRSVTWGTCALNGQHRDQQMARECPALRARQPAPGGVTRAGNGEGQGAHVTPPVTPQERRRQLARERIRRWRARRQQGGPS
jgi:hypothetical protein